MTVADRPGQFAGAVAVVTGAARGIGRAAATELARRGAAIVAVDVDPAVCDPGEVEPDKWRGLVGDVTDRATVEAMIRTTSELPGRAQLLVNNAFAEERAPLLEGTTEGWSRTYHVSTLAAVAASRALVQQLRGPASIVNVASVHAFGAASQFGAYAAAKAALVAFTRAAAVEWAPRGVRVNAVAPGFVAVERNTARWSRLSTRWMCPMGRAGRPEEVARAIAFLASDEASFVTGAVLPIDGGLLAKLPEEDRP